MTRYSSSNAKMPDHNTGDAHAGTPIEAVGFRAEERGVSVAEWARQDLEATLQLLADRAQYITGGTGAAIALRDGAHVLCRASSGASAPRAGSYLELGSGLSGESVSRRTTLRCDDTENDPRVDREACRQLGIASFAVMPIIRNDEVVGIFEIFAGKPRAFEERDIVALQRLGQLVNTALDEASGAPLSGPSFAMHGPTVKAETAVADSRGQQPAQSPAAPAVHPQPAFKVSSLTGPDMNRSPEGIRSCSKCGFPVSEGRTLCLDCEAAAGAARSAVEPIFLSETAPAPGMKQWILRNRYIIGMAAVSAATIAYALLR